MKAVATHDATVLLPASEPGRRGSLPRGASSDQVEAALPHRRVVDDTFADITGVPGPLKEAAPRWYRLRRSGG